MPTAYRFRDFAPAATVGTFFRRRTVETMPEVVDRANEWVARAGVRVVNIETVVLPVDSFLSAKRFDTEHNDFGYGERLMMQVVRVWYQEPG